MQRWLATKPKGFIDPSKQYDTSLEDQLLAEIEEKEQQETPAGGGDKLGGSAGGKAGERKGAQGEKRGRSSQEGFIDVPAKGKKANADSDLPPSAIKVRVSGLPKKKKITRDLRAAWNGQPGLLKIIPMETGSSSTRDPVCTGSAVVGFTNMAAAQRSSSITHDRVCTGSAAVGFTDPAAAQRFIQQYNRSAPIRFGQKEKAASCKLIVGASAADCLSPHPLIPFPPPLHPYSPFLPPLPPLSLPPHSGTEEEEEEEDEDQEATRAGNKGGKKTRENEVEWNAVAAGKGGLQEKKEAWLQRLKEDKELRARVEEIKRKVLRDMAAGGREGEVGGIGGGAGGSGRLRVKEKSVTVSRLGVKERGGGQGRVMEGEGVKGKWRGEEGGGRMKEEEQEWEEEEEEEGEWEEEEGEEWEEEEGGEEEEEEEGGVIMGEVEVMVESVTVESAAAGSDYIGGDSVEGGSATSPATLAVSAAAGATAAAAAIPATEKASAVSPSVSHPSQQPKGVKPQGEEGGRRKGEGRGEEEEEQQQRAAEARIEALEAKLLKMIPPIFPHKPPPDPPPPPPSPPTLTALRTFSWRRQLAVDILMAPPAEYSPRTPPPASTPPPQTPLPFPDLPPNPPRSSPTLTAQHNNGNDTSACWWEVFLLSSPPHPHTWDFHLWQATVAVWDFHIWQAIVALVHVGLSHLAGDCCMYAPSRCTPPPPLVFLLPPNASLSLPLSYSPSHRWDFHIWQAIVACMPPLALYLTVQYAKAEIARMEKELQAEEASAVKGSEGGSDSGSDSGSEGKNQEGARTATSDVSPAREHVTAGPSGVTSADVASVDVASLQRQLAALANQVQQLQGLVGAGGGGGGEGSDRRKGGNDGGGSKRVDGEGAVGGEGEGGERGEKGGGRGGEGGKAAGVGGGEPTQASQGQGGVGERGVLNPAPADLRQIKGPGVVTTVNS
ncbi:unnamed protein product [Closterium sp. Naga37s-1]|nr:unnamed protein product [Closterium sp. Naga37s-1]